MLGSFNLIIQLSFPKNKQQKIRKCFLSTYLIGNRKFSRNKKQPSMYWNYNSVLSLKLLHKIYSKTPSYRSYVIGQYNGTLCLHIFCRIFNHFWNEETKISIVVLKFTFNPIMISVSQNLQICSYLLCLNLYWRNNKKYLLGNFQGIDSRQHMEPVK